MSTDRAERRQHRDAQKRRRRALLGSIVVVVATAVAAVAILGQGGSGEHTLKGPAGDAFRLSYPSTWRRLGAAELAKLTNHPLASLARKDGKAVLTVRRDKTAAGVNGTKLANQLNATFRKGVKDYKLVSARILTTSAGKVFFYSYVRTKLGTLQTISLIPAGDHSYVLYTVSNPAANDAAAEIGEIIASFKPE